MLLCQQDVHDQLYDDIKYNILFFTSKVLLFSASIILSSETNKMGEKIEIMLVCNKSNKIEEADVDGSRDFNARMNRISSIYFKIANEIFDFLSE